MIKLSCKIGYYPTPFLILVEVNLVEGPELERQNLNAASALVPETT
jgi:hypothetical protein